MICNYYNARQGRGCSHSHTNQYYPTPQMPRIFSSAFFLTCTVPTFGDQGIPDRFCVIFMSDIKDRLADHFLLQRKREIIYV